jgi:ribulose-phosphate 3-epimerase
LSIPIRKGIIAEMAQDYLIVSSILNADLTRLGDVIQEIEAAGVDWIQIDVMDGHFVPNISFGPSLVEAIRKITNLPLDIHLMIEDPDRFLGAFAEAGADSLTVHVEACPHLKRTLSAIRELDLRAGVALKPDTPASTVIEFLPLVDLVLVMTVNPGFAGQTFIPSTLSKIHQIRSLIEKIDPRPRIQVDGGITAETAPKAALQGADTFVAGSAILKHPEGIQAGVEALRNSLSTVSV